MGGRVPAPAFPPPRHPPRSRVGYDAVSARPAHHAHAPLSPASPQPARAAKTEAIEPPRPPRRGGFVFNSERPIVTASPIRLLDIDAGFLSQDGKIPFSIMPDQLHPNAAGYQLWADAMKPMLTELMK